MTTTALAVLGLLVLGGCATVSEGAPVSQAAPVASSTAGPSASPSPPPASPTPTATVPAFQSTISRVTAGELSASWRQRCPVAVEDLRAVTVTHWDFSGGVRTGRLVVAAEEAESVVAIMRELFGAGFPIQRMEPVEAFDGSDAASMAANNTSAFNCRAVTGGTSWSEHSYGRAIDFNPVQNPYVKGGVVLPPAGTAYVNRSRQAKGMIHPRDAVVRAFAKRGWVWGGSWTSLKDYQHFSTTGR